MIKIQSCNIKHEDRVIFISDIHGDLDLLQNLLNKIEYTREDVLFINGDLCEKGPNSLGVVRYVMELQKQSSKVYVTQGNCDMLIQHIFNENDRILSYLDRKPNSILVNMLEEDGKTHSEFTSLKELGAFYLAHYANEIEWLLNLPTVYETEEFIIVHAGIENVEDWRETSLKNALSIDEFYEKGHKAEKTVIVGHWPAPNYRSSVPSSNNPLIDHERKMICIDGGNRVKFDGQINALILEDGQFTNTYVDQLEKKRIVTRSYEAVAGFVGTVTYPNYDMNPLKREKHFTLCENIHLGIKQWIKNEYVVEDKDGFSCKGDVSTTKISVCAGEEVTIIDEQCEGYVLVKKNGLVGWVPKECFDAS